MRFGREEKKESTEISPIFFNVLSQLDQDALLVAPGEVVRFSTEGIETLNILKDNRITSPELVALIRVVRRTQQTHTGKIEIPRGPIGEGLRELTVRAIYLADIDNIVVLLSDESEAERVHEVRRDFVANISHELKTPIGALSLLSEAVLSASDDPASVVKVTINGKTVTLPVCPTPGQKPGTIGIALGYGRGANGENIGKAAFQTKEYGGNVQLENGNPAPIGAAATAKRYEILVLHTKQEKLQIAIKVYIPRLIHAAGTCTYIILTISFCW